MNDGAETCRLLQIWMLPDRRGHTPQYGSSQYTDKDRANTLLQILHGTGQPPNWQGITRKGTPIHLHQDVNVFVSENEAGRKYELPLAPGRAAYIININGELDVNGVKLNPSDAAEVESKGVEDMPLTLTAGDNGSHFMVIEMAQLY
jgi:redox-sensitive bicupin YhaK (pirin superfamily)